MPLIDTHIPYKLEISNMLPPNFPGCRIVEHPICTYWFDDGYLTMQEINSEDYTLSYHTLCSKHSFPYRCKLDPLQETIIFCITGTSTLSINSNQETRISANQWLRVKDASSINWNNTNETLVEVLFLQYKGNLLKEMKGLFQPLYKENNNDTYGGAYYTPLESREYIQQILKCKLESELRRHFIDNKVGDILFNLLVNLNGHNPIQDYNQEDYEKIQQVERLLSEDLLQQRTLQSLADEIGMGLTKFKQLFKAIYHQTPADYQRKLRLAKATKYLLSGYSVKESAYKVGWRPPVFIEVFKEVYNTTPGKFKKERRSG